jgi:hypothetical protein
MSAPENNHINILADYAYFYPKERFEKKLNYEYVQWPDTVPGARWWQNVSATSPSTIHLPVPPSLQPVVGKSVDSFDWLRQELFPRFVFHTSPSETEPKSPFTYYVRGTQSFFNALLTPTRADLSPITIPYYSMEQKNLLELTNVAPVPVRRRAPPLVRASSSVGPTATGASSGSTSGQSTSLPQQPPSKRVKRPLTGGKAPRGRAPPTRWHPNRRLRKDNRSKTAP